MPCPRGVTVLSLDAPNFADASPGRERKPFRLMPGPVRNPLDSAGTGLLEWETATVGVEWMWR